MKNIYFIIFLFLYLGCKTNQDVSQESGSHLKEISCPENGNCTFEVLQNSILNIKTDEFGKLYPEVLPGDKVVIKFHYKKKELKKAVDGSYSEFIYLEVSKNEKQLILKDRDLQKAKLLFGRICFCGKNGGYYRVTQGNLYLFNSNGMLKMDLTFNVNKVPQIISKLEENISYYQD